MSIRMSLLALLSEQPCNGYQLRQEFEARTGATWPLNIGQAYTTLERLERDGLVVAVQAGNDGAAGAALARSQRYTLTDDGRAELAHWWSSPVDRAAPARDELAIKLAMAVTVPGVDVVGIVQRQRAATMSTLHQYTRLKAQVDPTNRSDLAWSLVLESLLFAAEAEIRWLDHIEPAVERASRSVEAACSDAEVRQPTPVSALRASTASIGSVANASARTSPQSPHVPTPVPTPADRAEVRA